MLQGEIIIENFGILDEQEGPVDTNFLATSPTPDSILQDWQGLARTDRWTFNQLSFWFADQSILDSAIILKQQEGPLVMDFVATSPTPDSILLDWQGLVAISEPWYPQIGSIEPGTGIFPGDFGAYIG